MVTVRLLVVFLFCEREIWIKSRNESEGGCFQLRCHEHAWVKFNQQIKRIVLKEESRKCSLIIMCFLSWFLWFGVIIWIRLSSRRDWMYLLFSELHQEQEEPDSACEATQYFFEDITPETSSGTAACSHLPYKIGCCTEMTVKMMLDAKSRNCDRWYWCFDLLLIGLDQKNKAEKDDGFVGVTFKSEKGGRKQPLLWIRADIWCWRAV